MNSLPIVLFLVSVRCDPLDQVVRPFRTTRKPLHYARDLHPAQMRRFTESLFALDKNNVFKYIIVRLQQKAVYNESIDLAPLPFLAVNQKIWDIPIYHQLRAMYNNFVANSEIEEKPTIMDVNERVLFLKAVMETAVMKHLFKFLVLHGIVPNDYNQFTKTMNDLWFRMYSTRLGNVGTCFFEHLFEMELRDGKVTGMRNWVYYHFKELNKVFNYLGYLKYAKLGKRALAAKIQFQYRNNQIKRSSMIVGSSPEFDMALYSFCYFTRENRSCPIRLNGKNMVIKSESPIFLGQYRLQNEYIVL